MQLSPVPEIPVEPSLHLVGDNRPELLGIEHGVHPAEPPLDGHVVDHILERQVRGGHPLLQQQLLAARRPQAEHGVVDQIAEELHVVPRLAAHFYGVEDTGQAALFRVHDVYELVPDYLLQFFRRVREHILDHIVMGSDYKDRGIWCTCLYLFISFHMLLFLHS